MSPAELRWLSKSSLLSSAPFSKHYVFLHSFVRKRSSRRAVLAAASSELPKQKQLPVHWTIFQGASTPHLCSLNFTRWLSVAEPDWNTGCLLPRLCWIVSQPSEKPTHLAGKTTSVQTRSCQLFINVGNSGHDALTRGFPLYKSLD